MAKGMTHVYPGGVFHITIANFDTVYFHLLKHRKVGEITSVSKEILHFKDGRFLYPPGAHANNSNKSVEVEHCKPTPDPLEHVTELEAVEKKEEEKLKKVWREDFQLPANFKTHQPGFL